MARAEQKQMSNDLETELPFLGSTVTLDGHMLSGIERSFMGEERGRILQIF